MRQASAALDRPVTPAPAAPEFAAVYRAQFAYVFRTLRRLGVRPRDVEDLVHDVFVVVYRHLGDYDPSRPIRPWLFGIAFRVASDDRRRARHTAEVPAAAPDAPDGGPSPDDSLASREQRDLVLAALETLDLDRRAVLILHDIDGCGAPAIATALGIPLNTVYSRLRVARERFAAAVRAQTGQRGEP